MRAAAFLLIAALAVGAPLSRAAESASSGSTDAAAALAASAVPAPPGETVVVFNRPVVHFRAGLLGMPATERAGAARSRIITLLKRGPGQVTTEELPQGFAVKIDGAYAFLVTNEDAGALGHEGARGMTDDAARALEKVVGETHEARTLTAMLTALAWAAGATVIYAILLWLMWRLRHFVTRRVMRFAEARGATLKVGGAEILQREPSLRLVRNLTALFAWAIALLLTYEWVGFVLRSFPFTRAWGEELDAFLEGTSLGILSAVARAAPDLFVAAIIFVIARWIDSVATHFFERVQSGRVSVHWLDLDTARPTRKLVRVAIWLFAVAMAYPYIPGSSTDAFKGLSVLFGLMISVGASGIVAQAASGLILMYTRTYRPGEFVRINEHEGTVVGIGMFNTRIRTGMGDELTLPNAMIMGAVTRNYSRVVKGAGFIVDAVVTIGYDAPWRQVHALLLDAARRTPGIADEPAPQVFQTSLSDFYVEYRLVCHSHVTDARPRAEVLSAVHANIQDTFNEHGVQIMSPHYLGDPAEAKVVPKAKWYTPPAVPPG
jgi:small-conductance mechanosensitive channel